MSFIWEMNDQRWGRDSNLRLNIYYHSPPFYSCPQIRAFSFVWYFSSTITDICGLSFPTLEGIKVYQLLWFSQPFLKSAYKHWKQGWTSLLISQSMFLIKPHWHSTYIIPLKAFVFVCVSMGSHLFVLHYRNKKSYGRFAAYTEITLSRLWSFSNVQNVVRSSNTE